MTPHRFLRTLLASSVLILCNPAVVLAQRGTEDTLSVQENAAKAWVDYAVPDMPAFAILGSEPTTVLRPTSAREVGVAIANFLSNGQVLPKAFAAEFAPYMLLANKSLSDYQRKLCCYRTRLSIGTRANDNGGTEIGLGLRFTLWDKSDLRTDAEFQKRVIRAVRAEKAIRDEYDRMYTSRGLKKDPDSFQRILDAAVEIALDSSERRVSLLGIVDAKHDSASVATVNRVISADREMAKDTKWNEGILEVGVAIMASSPDSTAKRLNTDRYALWLSGALPMVGNSGQAIGSLKASASRDAGDRRWGSEGSLSVRFYAGKNSHKGYLGFDGSIGTRMHAVFNVNLGGELNLANGLWIDFSVGLVKPSNADAKISSSLNVRLGTQEMKL